MQPFPVLCETCGAKLKVRDPASIGQIHPCPKCDSMVMIAAPAALASEQVVEPPASTPDLAADAMLAPTDFAAEIDQLLDTAPPSVDEVPDASVPSDSVSNPAEMEVADLNLAGVDDSCAAEAAVDSVEEAVAASGKHTLVWGVSGSVAFFAIGLLAAAWWSRGEEPVSVAAIAANTPADQTETIETPASKSLPSSELAPSETAIVEANKPVIDVASDRESHDSLSAASEAAASDVEANQVAVLPDLPPMEEQAEVAADSPPELSTMLQPLDPLAIDSANLDLLLIPEGEAADEVAPPELVAEKPVPELLARNREVAAPQKNIRFEPGSASRGPTFAEGFAEGELTSRLAMKLPSVAWNDAPLVQALDELSQVSGVPITIPHDALRMAGVRADRPVSVAKQNASVLELAEAAAAAVRLTTVRTPGGLVLAKKRAAEWREVKYRVSDLATTDGDTTNLAALIRKFVSPSRWGDDKATVVAKDGLLEINQQTAIHYEILIFCERLRKARGLTLRSKYPAALLKNEPRLVGASKLLSRSATFAFVDWTPLVEVFEYWQQSSGFILLVDWQRLADHDLRPMATMAASVNQATWGDAFDRSLAPLGLAWLPVDSNTLLITTQEAVEQTAWVELYVGADAGTLRERIETSSSQASLATFGLAQDTSGKFVIVLGNRSIHQAVQP